MLGDAMTLVALGVVVGGGVALLVTGLLDRILYGVSRLDPLAWGTVVVILGGAAGLAAYLPARRAASVDAMTAIRSE